jgi:acyl-CoA reductase-like NAD-dependent aldehyde dehydrogenase
LVFGDAAEAAGLPAGALNVVVESGFEGSALMTSHPAVDQISFTGSTAVGRMIMKQASATTKRVMLELGGKSVQLYLPDAVDRAPAGFPTVFANHAGQACVAATRMLVPHDRKAEVLEKGAAIASRLTVGNPIDPRTLVGPLISAGQRERCETYVKDAVAHGGRVVAGGGRPKSLPRGFYFEPTILDVPDNSNPAAQDEIFGPVVTVIGYDTIDEAVAIANDSPFGLSGQVFGPDLVQATEVATRIRAGAVNVNGLAASAYASSGGYKQSGLGRERGVDGLRAYQEIKHLSVSNW